MMVNDRLKFEDVLRPLCYVSADDEAVETLKLIFPFSYISVENMYDYETVILSASPKGWDAIFPLLTHFLSEDRERFDENISSSFIYLFENEWGFKTITSPWLKNQTEIERGITMFQINQLISKVADWNLPPEELTSLASIKSIISKTELKACD